MKKVDGTDIWIPDGDEHFNHARIVENYQADRLVMAYPKVSHWDTAIDVGAHVGLITRLLADRFRKVMAFEPDPEAFACLEENTKHLPNVVRYQIAVGGHCCRAGLDTRKMKNTGNRQILPDGDNVAMISLDSLDLDAFDLLKVDVQGYEWYVIKGAAKQLKYFRPVVIIEVEPEGKLERTFPQESKGAIRLLRRLGAEQVGSINADSVWRFPRKTSLGEFGKYKKRGAYHWDKYDKSSGFRELVDKVTALVRNGNHQHVLDVGCGDGLYTHLMGAYGIDSDPDAIRLAASRGVNCKLLDLWNLRQLSRQKWDAICLFDTLEHLYEQERVIALLGKHTDRLYILNPEPNDSEHHVREFTADKLSTWMKARGWRENRKQPMSASPSNLKTFFEFVKD